jgi:hypothetical protein
MAHRPIGAGISLTTGAASSMTTSFTAQTNVVRVVAVTAGAFVAIGTNPSATTSDYYIPAGSSSTLAITKASNRVVGVTTGTTTIIDCPEGTQAPFGVGDFVTLSGSQYHNFTHAEVISVNTSSSVDGYYQRRFTVNYNSSGILTAFTSPDATVSLSYRLAARTEGGAGTLYAQQVQISGQA